MQDWLIYAKTVKFLYFNNYFQKNANSEILLNCLVFTLVCSIIWFLTLLITITWAQCVFTGGIAFKPCILS